MTFWRWAAGVVAAATVAVALWQLHGARAGLTIVQADVGGTPVTFHHRHDAAPGPTVIIAHGFAGSRQLMQPFALTLAQAGYLAVSFDFEGHGRNPTPMSGDVTQIDGTTRLLMAETGRVADAALAHPLSDGRLALLGHSMASDIVVRQGIEDARTGAVIAVSMFSQAVTAEAPPNLLVIVGDWEARLKAEALRVLHLTDPAAGPGRTLGDPAQGTGRRAAFAPSVEHVGVLYSPTSLREARDWLDAAFDRKSHGAPLAATGGWVALLLIGVAALGWPLAGMLPRGRAAGATSLPARRFLMAIALPAVAVPLLLWPIETRVLPVLVADYLALHFALQGAMMLALLGWWGVLRRQFVPRVWWVAALVALFGIAGFGGALDAHVASFFPHAGRVPVVAALIAGAVPFMLADALLTEGGRAGLWRVIAVRTALLLSLALAVALNFERLFFLVIILPVIVLFFLLFGTMGGWVGRRTGLPAAGGIGLGVVLGWALGVTFPMFVLP
ncbi:MAG: alpha/beta hydrolase [Pararhodobacter sp.]|nr:alpha/beta hydrolase [Pararhodobacter sp.]